MWNGIEICKQFVFYFYLETSNVIILFFFEISSKIALKLFQNSLGLFKKKNDIYLYNLFFNRKSRLNVI